MHRTFFYLLLLFLPTQLGFHFWPAWSMVLGRKIDYLSPTLFFTDILIVLILVFWLRKLPLIPVLILTIVAGVNIFFSLNKMVATYHWIKFAELGMLGYYVFKTKPNLSRVSHFLSLSVLYSSCIATLQFLLQHSLGGPFWFLGERTFAVDTPGIARVVLAGKEFLRAYGTFPHPNVLGGYLAIVLLFIIQKVDRKNLWYWSTVALGIVALLLTFSRSAWIVAALGMGWAMWKKTKFFSFILVSCLLSFVSISFHPMDESVVVRQQLNNSAVHMFVSAPLFGVGLGNFLVTLPDVLPSRAIYFLQPVHNIYLLLLAEVGIVGVSLIVLVAWSWWRQVTSDKRHVFHVACCLSLVSILLLGLVDHYPLTLQQGQLLLTLFLALSYRAPR